MASPVLCVCVCLRIEGPTNIEDLLCAIAYVEPPLGLRTQTAISFSGVGGGLRGTANPWLARSSTVWVGSRWSWPRLVSLYEPSLHGPSETEGKLLAYVYHE